MNETSPSPSGKRFRKLRITFSAACGIVCLLLIALWVRSYWWADLINVDAPSPLAIQLTSARGITTASIYKSEQGWDWVRVPPEYFPIGGSEKCSFQLYELKGVWTIMAPHWFSELLSATFAVVPWLRWRFSLRTLLIAITLMAVVLGVLVWASS